MSTLLLLLPPRPRLRAPGQTAPLGEPQRADAAREYDYVLTADGQQVLREGRSDVAQLPAADTVIAVLPESDVSWRRVELPRAGRQMRAALAGKLEESLLDEPEALHFALEPDAQGGDTAWVAITSRPWLAEHLAHFDAAQVFVDRVAPLSWPDEAARGHFFETQGGSSEGMALRWAHADGVATLPLNGGLARQLFPPGLVHAAQWSATPAVATAAERWLGTAVSVKTPTQRALGVLDSAWNLRQFDLAPRARGTRALRLLGRGLMRKPWQPARYGIAALLAVQLLGLNLWAWQQKQLVQGKRLELTRILRQAHPQVTAVLDAPVQMQRETEALRAAAGQPGDNDLEALMGVVATAWPPERPSATLDYDGSSLTLSAPAGWGPDELIQLRARLAAAGIEVEPTNDGKLMVRRAPRS